MLFWNDNNDSSSDTVSNLAASEQPETEEVLSPQKNGREKRKRCEKQGISADTEDTLINWIRESPCLYQTGLREYRYTEKK